MYRKCAYAINGKYLTTKRDILRIIIVKFALRYVTPHRACSVKMNYKAKLYFYRSCMEPS